MVIDLVRIKKVVFNLLMEPSKCVFEGRAHKDKIDFLKIIIKPKEVIDSLLVPNNQKINKSNHYFQH